jgi:trehalose synthase
MSHSLQQIALEPAPPDVLSPALGAEVSRRLDVELTRASRSLSGHTIWMISSTAVGGGVAELLRALVPYWLAAGIDVRWVVLRAPPGFFAVTKRLHNWLHGHPGDGGDLGALERGVYEQFLAGSGEELAARVGSRDVVVLHDPQTAGLLPRLAATGAKVVWRSHVGADQPNELSRAAWAFLTPYVALAAAVVFTRRGFVPPQLAELPVWVIPPCIDPCATKNRELTPATGRAILNQTGIASTTDTAVPPLIGRDGARVVVRQRCGIRRVGASPRLGCDRIIVHLARWDRLKDPVGVVDCFVAHVWKRVDAHLVVAGPGVRAVADDPEAAGVYQEVETRWCELPLEARRRIHLVRLPLHDIEANAAIVNALQRHADVVLKQSLQEGFGLGVTEAMWKRRAVVATAVGGHREQIEDGLSGVLIDNPRDLAAVGAAVVDLLHDPAHRSRLGEAAHRRVHDRFLPDRYLEQWLALLAAVTTSTRTRKLVPTRTWERSSQPMTSS